jgi:thiosulfate dehydrogenase
MQTFLKVLGTCILGVSFMWAGSAPKKYPDGELGRMVKLGEAIMMDTSNHPLTKDFVGNKLSCVSCHLKGPDGKPGTVDTIGSFMGTATAFPAYSNREKTVQTLQDRINNCFMRSMNGKRPIVDTEASIAMATYVTWLSEGMPMHMDPKRPVNPAHSAAWANNQKKFGAIQKKATHENYLQGKKIFLQKCAMCHGQNGQGVGTFPPLWGKNKKGEWLAYNTGAGMSKLNKAAPWIKENMPFGQGNTLSDQEAADVALYVDAQERAPFDLSKGLLPREKMGYYNSKVSKEKHSVRSNFAAFGLDVDKIRGDKKIK